MAVQWKVRTHRPTISHLVDESGKTLCGREGLPEYWIPLPHTFKAWPCRACEKAWGKGRGR